MREKTFEFKGIVRSIEFQVITNSFVLAIGIAYTPKYREFTIGVFNVGCIIHFR